MSNGLKIFEKKNNRSCPPLRAPRFCLPFSKLIKIKIKLKVNEINHLQVKRNKEFIATNIQEIFNNPFQVAAAAAQISQPIDLQKLFMHQLNQTIPPQLMSPQQSLAIQQEIAAMQAAAAAVNLNGNPPNPLLNGCTPISTLVTNTNINVTYLNGAIGKYDNKMHQGFIAVLKVSKMHKKTR